jgi:hypothetical protein
VKAGDTLYTVSQSLYGKQSPAEDILAANKDKLPDWSNWNLGQQLPVGISLRKPY